MITQAEIDAAQRRIAPYVRQTPILRVDGEDFGLEAGVTLKLELLQQTGSFKPRGAFNRLLNSGHPGAGVVAASGGNHGAAVAFAAQRLGVQAEIFVPEPTPAMKCRRIEAYGAKLIRGGVNYAAALASSRARVAETGALEVHAFDHPDVVAGQGTVGLEFQSQAPDLTHILVACGGGGLIGGIAAWYGGEADIIAVEPKSCPALHDALQAGQPVPAGASGVAADSLGASQVGQVMFEVARRFVSTSVLVDDDAIVAAQRLLWQSVRLIAEPGGVAALAALTSGAWVPPAGAKIGVVVCGANTDPGSACFT